MLYKAKTARLVITLYRHSTDKLPTSYRHISNCWPTVGRLSADCRPTDSLCFGENLSAVCRPTNGRQSADRFFGELFFTITGSLVNQISGLKSAWPRSRLCLTLLLCNCCYKQSLRNNPCNQTNIFGLNVTLTMPRFQSCIMKSFLQG